jgi:hypothetical protein
MADIASDEGRVNRGDVRIYRYVVRVDTGAAPNPFGGWCTLAICKPRIRSSARKGDWVIGFRSRAPGQVVYVMQVQDTLTFPAYWKDGRFAAKKPDLCRSSDNIYRPNSAGVLTQVPNLVHHAEDVGRDLRSPMVLASRRFWYFGASGPELGTDLVHLVHSGIGETYKRRRDGDIARLEEWASAWRVGVHGEPVDAAMLPKAGRCVKSSMSKPPTASRCAPAQAKTPRARLSKC